MFRIIKDHLGHEFRDQREMAARWGINYETFQHRRNELGWSIKKTLTTDSYKPILDHLGNEYGTISDMAKQYGITGNVLRCRLSVYGWTLKRALTTPVERVGGNNHKCSKDHLGHKFSSIKEMTKFWGVDYNTYQRRRNIGWSLERALTAELSTDTKVTYDHLGIAYSSMKAMAEAYNISQATVRSRLKRGWSVESALTTPLLRSATRVKHLGD